MEAKRPGELVLGTGVKHLGVVKDSLLLLPAPIKIFLMVHGACWLEALEHRFDSGVFYVNFQFFGDLEVCEMKRHQMRILTRITVVDVTEY